MSVRTEFEIRFIFDVTRPLPSTERDILLETLGKLGRLRLSRGVIGTDIAQLEQALRALPVDDTDQPVRPLKQVTQEEEERQIRRALRQAQTVSGAARLLGINRNTLQEKVDRFKITRESWRAA